MRGVDINIYLEGESSMFERFTYPAGEAQIRLRPDYIPTVARATRIALVARMPYAGDVMGLALAMSAIRSVSTAPVSLVIPYLPYGRADRPFVPGDCFGLRTYGEAINNLGFARVVTLDAHSGPRAKAHIDRLVDVSPMLFISRAIARFGVDRVTVLFPDKGARERYQIPEVIGYNLSAVKVQVLHCEKRRDPATGKLLGFDVPASREFASTNVLIVDDICDGGGTFLGIAEVLKANDFRLGLYVTHGIFSKGTADLLSRFPNIYTTDSFSQNDPDVRVFSAGFALYQALADAEKESK